MATLESKWNFDLSYVIQHDRVGGKSPPVDVANRQEVIEALEEIVLHYETRDDYFADLKTCSGGKFRRLTPLDEALETRLVKQGMSAARNEELAALALNPVALWQLADAVQDAFPEAWWGALSRVSQRVLEQDGIDIASAAVPIGAGSGRVREHPSPRAEIVGGVRMERQANVGGNSRQVRADECHWERGDASLVADQRLTVAWRWHEHIRSLEVRVTGFVKLGDGARTDFGWTDCEGKPRAPKESPLNPQSCSVFLRANDEDIAPPRPGDQLTITHCWEQSGQQGCKFTIKLDLGASLGAADDAT